MKTRSCLRAWIILGMYLAATCVLLLWGYSVQKPAVERQEFPFSITYSYQGKSENISGVYIAEYCRDVKYIGDNSIAWNGYIKDHDRRFYDYYEVVNIEDRVYSINVNLEPGYLMGDSAYAGSVCQPTAQYNYFDGIDDNVITDPAQLAQLGFCIVDWQYPAPIENTFSFGGFSLSSEATVYTAVIAVVALLLSMILIRKKPNLTYGKMDKFAIILNLAVAIYVFPFILVTSVLSEIVADTSIWQQILYFTPTLTALGIAASVTLRRLGQKYAGFWIQFAGPAIFALCLLFDVL